MTKKPKLPVIDPDDSLSALLIRVANRVERDCEAALHSHEINPRQFSALAHLARNPGISAAALARKVRLTPQSMSESLTLLVSSGLVKRSAPVAPGKSGTLEIAAEGLKVLTRAEPIVAHSNRQAFEPLSAKEQRRLKEMLLLIARPTQA